ncbi:TrmB family transcriptional regulator [Saccharomonospora viridis]|uniref:TrmB family transcriptional regulator n=1 Tax=Saccharomonospora viridis TaxID=1852 RepID=UPI0023F23C21|nr:helix-turn-helix domain-containing protein [Saccharomonospora viridis]
MDEEAVSELVKLGLTRYEAQGYLALIGRGDATPAETARLGRIPRPRAYDVLASLAERGFVTPVSGGPGLRYRAKPPNEVFESLMAVRRQELDQLAERSRKIVAELQPRFLEGQRRDEPLDYVEVLRDPAHAVQRVERLWNEARNEILAIVCPPYLAPPEPHDATLPTGVTIRVIYERSLLEDPRLERLVRTYARLGEEVRFGDQLPLKLTIIDEQSVAFNMSDPVEDDTSVTTIIVHHSALAISLRIAFETLWAQASTFEDVLD